MNAYLFNAFSTRLLINAIRNETKSDLVYKDVKNFNGNKVVMKNGDMYLLKLEKL